MIYDEHFFGQERTVKYDGSSFEDWWLQAGSLELNRVAIDYTDVNVYFPITNLIQIPPELRGYSPEKLAYMIGRDGVNAYEEKGTGTVYVNMYAG